jgi:hypothetical protein
MPADKYIMGLFLDEDRAVTATRGILSSPWALHKIHSPIPSHKLIDTLKLKKSKVGYFTLAGGIIGFFCGFLLAIFTATQWNLMVGGKPIVAMIPFFIVGFEFTILFAVFGNVIGMLILTRLPRSDNLKFYDARCSGGHFGILASCKENQEQALTQFFQENGGEVKTFD